MTRKQRLHFILFWQLFKLIFFYERLSQLFECPSLWFFVSCIDWAESFTLINILHTVKWIIGILNPQNLALGRCPAGRASRTEKAVCLRTWWRPSAPAWEHKLRARLCSCPCIRRHSHFQKTHSWRDIWRGKGCKSPWMHGSWLQPSQGTIWRPFRYAHPFLWLSGVLPPEIRLPSSWFLSR